MAQVISSRAGSSLADVVELILDKGLVIDLLAEVSLLGINIVQIKARVIVASLQTYVEYLKYAEGLGRGTVPAPPPALMAAAGGRSPAGLMPAAPRAYLDVPVDTEPAPTSVTTKEE
jgi:hypothetical protein